MAAVVVSDAEASNLGPNLLDDVAWPCCLDDGIDFVYSNHWDQTIGYAHDRVANDQLIPNDEHYGEAM